MISSTHLLSILSFIWLTIQISFTVLFTAALLTLVGYYAYLLFNICREDATSLDAEIDAWWGRGRMSDDDDEDVEAARGEEREKYEYERVDYGENARSYGTV